MTSTHHTSSNRGWSLDLIVLTALIAIFYLFWLGHYPLFTPDEGRYSEIAREMIATGDYITPRLNGVVFLDKPILHYWLQAIAIRLFGLKESAFRLFPAMCGIAGCLMTYSCGRLLFNRRAGLLSAIILATTPLYFGGAHYANLDLEVAIFISSSLLLFIAGVHQTGSSRRYLLYAAYFSAALAALTKGLIGVVFPVLIIGAWITLLWRWDILKKMYLPSGILIFSLTVLPWYYLVQRANPEFLHYFFVTQQFTRFTSMAVFNNKTVAWFYVPVVLIGFFPWTIFLIAALSENLIALYKNAKAHAITLFLVLWTIIIFAFFSTPHSKIITYILPIFPALALIVGNYLSDHWETYSEKKLFREKIIFLVSSILMSIILLAIAYFPIIDIAATSKPYLITIATIFIISALCSFLLFRKSTLKAFFIICALSSMSSLGVLVLAAPQLNQTSAKSLVIRLKMIIRPQDEVASYFKYYQDVPLYLERKISVVANWENPNISSKDNWIRELWNERTPSTKNWLIEEKTFWQRFKSKNRVFVFINANYLAQFKLHTRKYFYIETDNDIILLSNQPSV